MLSWLLEQTAIANGRDPLKVETEKYWKSIWEKDATHNGDAQWLKDLKAQHCEIPEQTPVTVTAEDIRQRVNQMRSWAAPGPDMIHAFWLKKLTALHSRLATQMSQLIARGVLYLKMRRTLLANLILGFFFLAGVLSKTKCSCRCRTLQGAKKHVLT